MNLIRYLSLYIKCCLKLRNEAASTIVTLPLSCCTQFEITEYNILIILYQNTTINAFYYRIRCEIIISLFCFASIINNINTLMIAM